MNETNGTGNWAGVRKRAGNLRVPPALMRLGAQQLGRRVLDPGLTWEVQRRRLDQLTRGAVVPRGTTVTESTMNGVRAEVVTVGGARPERTVVHFHGGGYCVGSARTARAWAAHLSARAGCRVVLPEYRLAPEHPYPAALEDARAVMKALLRDVTPASVVVSGDSAGGGLALSAMLAWRNGSEILPAGCILVSPWLDLSRDRRDRPDLVRRDVLLSPGWLAACAAAYAPSDRADPSVSPLFAAPGGLPGRAARVPAGTGAPASRRARGRPGRDERAAGRRARLLGGGVGRLGRRGLALALAFHVGDLLVGAPR